MKNAKFEEHGALYKLKLIHEALWAPHILSNILGYQFRNGPLY